MMVVDAGRNPLPYVWSGWWWVFTAIRGPRSATPATSASRARFALLRRRGVDQQGVARPVRHDAAVVDHPATLGLDEGEDPRCQLVEV
jgi:hypothetical protein